MILRKVVRKIIYTINFIIPKNKKYIFLRSSIPFRDNIEALLDCMISNKIHTKYKIICSPKDTDKFDIYKNVRGIIVSDRGYLTSLWYFFRSKYVILDNGLFTNPKPVKKQTIVNVWHGVSFKKIGFYQETEKSYRTATYAVTYSDLFAEKISYAFGVPFEDVLQTGEPRNDYLFKPSDKETLKKLGMLKNGNEKIIFWMPTYRQSKFENVDDGKKYEFGIPLLTYDRLSELNSICKAANVILTIKWHSLQQLPDNMDIDLSNIVFLTSEQVTALNEPLYSILANADALITDYSSVYINFMVLDRPICFAYDDLDYYKKNRGFMFDDIERLMPGKKTNELEGLYSFILDVSIGNDPYKEERASMKLILNRHNDCHNCERLLHRLGLL